MNKELPATLQAKVIEHALAEYPKEACGLVAVVRGRRRYFPCDNVSETPEDHFMLDGWEIVEDLGEIVAVVHSHPRSSPAPSEADRVACGRSKLPWYIVNPNTKEWSYTEPEDYELPYIGRKFSMGTVDCYSLVCDWYKREKGLTLGEYQRPSYEWWERGESLYVDNFENEGFRRVSERDLQYGDVLLMHLGANVPNHSAVYVGDNQILHHVQGRLSSRDSYGSYYRNSTAYRLRHESS